MIFEVPRDEATFKVFYLHRTNPFCLDVGGGNLQPCQKVLHVTITEGTKSRLTPLSHQNLWCWGGVSEPV